MFFKNFGQILQVLFPSRENCFLLVNLKFVKPLLEFATTKRFHLLSNMNALHEKISLEDTS